MESRVFPWLPTSARPMICSFRLQAADSLRIKSLSHGAVAAILAVARELDVAGTIDRHLASVAGAEIDMPRAMFLTHVAAPNATMVSALVKPSS
jgi:hypothetical protein